MSQHTETPWSVENSPYKASVRWVTGPTGVVVAMLSFGGTSPSTPTLRDGNAAFIVRACNSHEALVAACNTLLDAYNEQVTPSPMEWRAIEAALKLAKGDA